MKRVDRNWKNLGRNCEENWEFNVLIARISEAKELEWKTRKGK